MELIVGFTIREFMVGKCNTSFYVPIRAVHVARKFKFWVDPMPILVSFALHNIDYCRPPQSSRRESTFQTTLHIFTQLCFFSCSLDHLVAIIGLGPTYLLRCFLKTSNFFLKLHKISSFCSNVPIIIAAYSSHSTNGMLSLPIQSNDHVKVFHYFIIVSLCYKFTSL